MSALDEKKSLSGSSWNEHLRSVMTVSTFMIHRSNLTGCIGASLGPSCEANEDLNPCAAWGKDVNSCRRKPEPYRSLGSISSAVATMMVMMIMTLILAVVVGATEAAALMVVCAVLLSGEYAGIMTVMLMVDHDDDIIVVAGRRRPELWC